jgi:hypothetical protein
LLSYLLKKALEAAINNHAKIHTNLLVKLPQVLAGKQAFFKPKKPHPPPGEQDSC